MFVLRSDWCGIFAREAVSNGDILCYYHKEDLLFLKWILLLLQFSPALSHMTHACILVSMTSLLTHTALQMFAGNCRDSTGKLECRDFKFMGIACIPAIPVIFKTHALISIVIFEGNLIL